MSTIEVSKAIVDDLLLLEKGIRIYDTLSKADFLVVGPLICAACDNVRASELVNHQGSKATKLCLLCMVSNSSVLVLYFHLYLN